MKTSRIEFFKESLASLGFIALPGGLFAAPPKWKHKGKERLILGVVSDTHIRNVSKKKRGGK